MKRIVWTTDLHLNFLNMAQAQAFGLSIAQKKPDTLLITGDIGEAHDVHLYLELMAETVPTPICFVLGNHDYYDGSIEAVRERITRLTQKIPSLRWLPRAGVVPLSESTCLVGHDGWADGRFGDYANSHVVLSDYMLIFELRDLSREERLIRLNALGDEAAEHFRTVLPSALASFQHIIVATHVPPFREACWHEGNISTDEYLPHFACKAVGEVLASAMRKHPDRQMTVLCGHSHSSGLARILPNLLVKTGAAVYGKPGITEIIQVR